MKNFDEIACPVDRIMRVLMGPWTPYILWILHTQGPQRFGALRRAMPAISTKMLTERLRMLENEHLVHRDYKPTIPPEVTYQLTDKGLELQDVLDDLKSLAFKWYAPAENTPSAEAVS